MSRRKSAHSRAKSEYTAPGKRRLLLIEPNERHQELLSNLICDYPLKDQLDYRRIHTRDEALKALKKEIYHLILSADTIDNMSSPWLETLRSLQPDTPIVLLTSSSDAQKISDYVRGGATEVLLKSQESLKTLPKLFRKYLHGDAGEESMSGIFNNKHNVHRILRRLNKFSELSGNFPDLPTSLKSIRSDIAHLTKMVRDLL